MRADSKIRDAQTWIWALALLSLNFDNFLKLSLQYFFLINWVAITQTSGQVGKLCEMTDICKMLSMRLTCNKYSANATRYGLHYVPPKLLCWSHKPVPQNVTVFGERVFDERPCEYAETLGSGLHIRREASGQTKPADPLILDRPLLELWDIKFLLFTPPSPWYFVMAAWAD